MMEKAGPPQWSACFFLQFGQLGCGRFLYSTSALPVLRVDFHYHELHKASSIGTRVPIGLKRGATARKL